MLGLGNNLTKYKFNNINITKILIKNFKSRVLAEDGVFEAESCLLTTLTQLNKI